MKSPALVVVLLCLAFLMVTPGPVLPRAHAMIQNGLTTWSPYGPRTPNLELTVYSDFQPAIDAFKAGQSDITDEPILSVSDVNSFMANPDFFVTTPTPGIRPFALEINHQRDFLGVKQQENRTAPTPGIIGLPATGPGCSMGFGRLVVNLVNQEQANAVIRDTMNKLVANGPQTFSVADPAASGTYNVPSSSSCMLAGTYTISTTVYSGTANVFVGSAQIVTVTFGVDYNSPSTIQESQAGIEVRRALAHLIDKPSFVQNLGPSLAGTSPNCNDLQASLAAGFGGSCRPAADDAPTIAQSVLDEDLSEHPWANAQGILHEASAYNLQPDTVGGGSVWWGSTGAMVGASSGYSGVSDIRAACDHFMMAGFHITPSTATCADVAGASAGSVAPSSYPHLVANGQLIMYIRTHQVRKVYGQIFADSINFLFGTPNNAPGCVINYGQMSPGTGCTPTYYTFSQVANIIFLFPENWNLYENARYSGPFDEGIFQFQSSFASSVCGSQFDSQPVNTIFYCDPAFDTQAQAGESASSLSEAVSFFANAAIRAHRNVMNVPILSQTGQFAALNGWSTQDTSVPTRSSLAVGLNGFLAGSSSMTLLNMRCNTGFTPSNPAYKCGGGTGGLIRRGLSQEIHQFSPFAAIPEWDFEVVTSIFDTLLVANPTVGSGEQFIDWMTTSHSSSFNPSELSCLPASLGGTCMTGTTTQTWPLRNDLLFHDGASVTADDVVFSLIAARDVPSFSLPRFSFLPPVTAATALNPTTVQVKIQGHSFFNELDIGSVPIVPKHLWFSHCSVNGVIGAPGNECASPAFDPSLPSSTSNPNLAGIMVGSGPWVCGNSNTGKVGGGCSRNPDGSVGTQFVSAGGKVKLVAYDRYMRGRPGIPNSSLHKLSWADRNNDGVVNILDVADAALHFGQPDSYWNTGQNPQAPSVGTDPNVVDIGEIATVAFYFDHGTTAPFLPSQLTGLDPCIDPFFQTSPPC